jgi:hypothetical protein
MAISAADSSGNSGTSQNRWTGQCQHVEQPVGCAHAVTTGRRSKAGGKGSRWPANQSDERSASGTSGAGWPVAWGASRVASRSPARRDRWLPVCGCFGGENDPVLADQFLQGGLSLVDRTDDFQRLFDDHQQSHRFMDLDHLQRQAGSQVGTGPLHDSEQAGQVVHDFAATAIAFVIDGRKVIFQVDSGADRTSRQQGRFEYVPIGIRQRIVGNQEHPSIEKRPAAHRAAADESRRNGGMPEFGPRLARCPGAGLPDVPAPVVARGRAAPMRNDGSARRHGDAPLPDSHGAVRQKPHDDWLAIARGRTRRSSRHRCCARRR